MLQTHKQRLNDLIVDLVAIVETLYTKIFFNRDLMNQNCLIIGLSEVRKSFTKGNWLYNDMNAGTATKIEGEEFIKIYFCNDLKGSEIL